MRISSFNKVCLNVLVVFCFAFRAMLSHGQAFSFSDGTKTSCTTAGGKIVSQIYLPALAGPFLNQGYTGVTIYLPDGSARITWDTAKLDSLLPAMHDFIYFHECAHAHVPTSDELMANCVGLIDMRAANRSSASIEQQLGQFHASLGNMGPRYGMGSDYWNKTLQCANSGGPKIKPAAPKNTTTVCSFTSGPKAGQTIDFGKDPGVIPAMIGAPCSDGTGSFGMAVPSSSTSGSASSGVQGDWLGTLQQWNLAITMHLAAGGTGTADGPSQNAFGMPLQYSVSGNKVNLSIPSVGATFSATVSGSQMNGTFSQNGQNVPLTLTKI